MGFAELAKVGVLRRAPELFENFGFLSYGQVMEDAAALIVNHDNIERDAFQFRTQ